MGQALLRHDLDWLGLPSRNWHNYNFIFAIGPKDPKKMYLHLFFHAWTFELSSTNPLLLFLSSTISQTNVLSSLEDLKTRSHRQGAMGSTKFIQIELNQKGWNTYLQGWFFPFLVSGVVRVSHLSKPAGICWNLPLVSSLRSVEWRVYGVLFFTACLQQKVRALQVSSSTVFNYFGHVWSQLSCHAIYCHLFMWDVCFFTRTIRITAKHFVECLMRYVRLVWDHGRLRSHVDGLATLDEKQMAVKGALHSMLFVRVLSSYCMLFVLFQPFLHHLYRLMRWSESPVHFKDS